MDKNRKKNLGEEEGAAAVEFALVLPLLSLFIFGIIVFGMIFNSWLQVTHAAREGVRWAALRASDDIKAKIIASAPGLKLKNDDIKIDPAPPYTEAQQDKPVTVTITYPLPSAITNLGKTLGSIVPDKVTSTAVMRIE